MTDLSNDLRARLHELLALTDELHTLAQNDDWDVFEERHKQRNELLRDTVKPDNYTAISTHRDMLETIFEKNMTLTQLAKEKRENIRQELSMFRGHRKANQAYQSNQ